MAAMDRRTLSPLFTASSQIAKEAPSAGFIARLMVALRGTPTSVSLHDHPPPARRDDDGPLALFPY
jgi:hypothetical protein